MVKVEDIVEIEEYLVLREKVSLKMSFFFIRLSQEYRHHLSIILSVEICRHLFGFTYGNLIKSFFRMI